MARDPYRYFRIEARELLEQLGQGVLDLEKGRPNPDLVARLLRLAHTLKGAARVVKQPETADRVHALEDVLAAVREAGAAASREHIDRCLALLDDIGARVAALAPAPGSAAAGPTAPGLTGPAAGLESEELFRAFRPDIHEMDLLLNAMTEAHGRFAALHSLVSRVERGSHLADLVADHLESSMAREVLRPGERAASDRGRGLAHDLRSAFAALERDFARQVDALEREFGEAWTAAERLRLVPVSALFTLLERTARDTARALGKRVGFIGHGGDVRVDVQIVATAQTALLQMVRNAVAHGIEPPEERRAAGKSEDGRVSVQVIRRGSRVVFRCEDDGRGVDLDAVRRLARDKGLLPAETQELAAQEMLRLLLKGGISTSASVTEVSGRGVGLDVVREAAERLRGQVSVESEAGRGTTFELSAPFALASVPVLAIESSGVKALLPLEAVRGSMRVPPDAIVHTAEGESLLYDGQSVRLASLANALVPHRSSAGASGPVSAVIVHARGGVAAFGVDRVLGTTTVVVQPLPDLAPAAPYVAGAALDEGGVPQLVLDPEALVAGIGRSPVAADRPSPARSPVLVVDDSLTTRMLEQSILESAGYVVDLATSGEEALAKARETQYALFLVDVEMPGMDGFTFIQRTRTEPELSRTPAILVTSRNSPEDRQRGKEVGAQAYIVKSEFDQRELLDRIRELVGA